MCICEALACSRVHVMLMQVAAEEHKLQFEAEGSFLVDDVQLTGVLCCYPSQKWCASANWHTCNNIRASSASRIYCSYEGAQQPSRGPGVWSGIGGGKALLASNSSAPAADRLTVWLFSRQAWTTCGGWCWTRPRRCRPTHARFWCGCTRNWAAPSPLRGLPCRPPSSGAPSATIKP